MQLSRRIATHWNIPLQLFFFSHVCFAFYQILLEFRPIISPKDLQFARLPANIKKNRSPDILPGIIRALFPYGLLEWIQVLFLYGYPDCPSCTAHSNSIGWTICTIWAAVKKYSLSCPTPAIQMRQTTTSKATQEAR